MAQTKYLDLTGLGHFWTKVKAYVDENKVSKSTKINGFKLEQDITLGGANINVGGVGTHAGKTIQAAINDLDDAVKAAAAAGVLSIGEQSGAITLDAGTADGSVKLAVSAGKVMSGSVTGWGALVNNVNSKASQTALDAANTKIKALEDSRATKDELSNAQTALQGSIDAKADKTAAIKSVKVSGSASATATTVSATVTVTPTTAKGDVQDGVSGSFTIPAADAAAAGVVTLNKITEIAASEAGKAATSAYKVKGTKATLAEVLAVSSATIGDVYNITAEFTLVGKKYPAGTNVVFIGDKAGNDPKQPTQWDALGGTVDLTPYAKTDYVNAELGKKVDTGTFNDFKAANTEVIKLKLDAETFTTWRDTNYTTHVSNFSGLKSAYEAHVTEYGQFKDATNAALDLRVHSIDAKTGALKTAKGKTGLGEINFSWATDGITLEGKAAGLGTMAGRNANEFALVGHKHTIADITDFGTILTADIDKIFNPIA